jgi:predicted amidohydrolase
MRPLNVALLQMTPCGDDPEANLSKGEAFCRRARDLGRRLPPPALLRPARLFGRAGAFRPEGRAALNANLLRPRHVLDRASKSAVVSHGTAGS